ncbi:MAG: polyprenol monophosphomannose synthase [Candidatus Aenigmarchaeota archaeon]|nr:polyprenol monophosphomannose synthase [Candidatus Aenigmarchaeota archaeon]
MISIVLPTYNERENLEGILNAIRKYVDADILIVDDNSPDGTGDIADKLKKKYRNVDVLHRTAKNGLGYAILDGFKHCSSDVVGVMDADFSHPPAVLKKMIESIKQHDMVIASRYIPGGGTDESWSGLRRFISKFAIIMVYPLIKIKDPMSGFFLVRRSAIGGIELNPESCKICLEILVKGRIRSVAEIPYIFTNRKAGKSKIMNTKQILKYIKHVIGLYAYRLRGFLHTTA